jgi:predicted DNA-binding transcriptional regulator AlpA
MSGLRRGVSIHERSRIGQLSECNDETVYRLAQERELPGSHLVGAWRFKGEDIDQWFENQTKAAVQMEDNQRCRHVHEQTKGPAAGEPRTSRPFRIPRWRQGYARELEPHGTIRWGDSASLSHGQRRESALAVVFVMGVRAFDHLVTAFSVHAGRLRRHVWS